MKLKFAFHYVPEVISRVSYCGERNRGQEPVTQCVRRFLVIVSESVNIIALIVSETQW